jgi:ribosomal protein S18 acetylase RimI-like enzyme
MQPIVEHPEAAHPSFDIRPARMDDIHSILQLHREAFADKFGAAFGRGGTDRGLEAMAEAWRRQGPMALRSMFVATDVGRVIGTTSLCTAESGGDLTGQAELAFQKVLGSWGALRSIYALSLLTHTIERSEGYVTDVSVLGEYRRQGVARALLARAEQEARIRSKHFLGLFVSSSNSAARALYEQCGFQIWQVRRSPMAGIMLRQFTWLYMRKEL